MTIITIHDSKKEGEGHNLEDGRIDFAICGILVGIYRNLVELKHVIGLERGRWGRAFAVSAMPHLELSGTELGKLRGDFVLLGSRDPNEANKGLALETELIQCVIDGFLFGYEPFIDLKSGHVLLTLLVRGGIHLKEVVFELTKRSLIEILRLHNSSFSLSENIAESVHLRDLESLTHE